MTKEKKIQKEEKNIVAVEEALTKTEQFIEKNQKSIIYILGVIVAIIAIYVGVTRFYFEPREKEAQSQIFMAERYLEKDSISLALNGDGQYPGFLDIIDEYSMTKTAKLAHHYAGICQLRLGQYDEAITHLKKFKGKDKVITAMNLGLIGDAYLEKGDFQEAYDYYIKASEKNANNFTTPLFIFKAGMMAEELKKYDKAEELFNTIKREYRSSAEFRNIDKYIGRVQALNKK